MVIIIIIATKTKIIKTMIKINDYIIGYYMNNELQCGLECFTDCLEIGQGLQRALHTPAGCFVHECQGCKRISKKWHVTVQGGLL